MTKSIPNEATKISYKNAYSCCSVVSAGNKESGNWFLILIRVPQTITSYQISNFAHIWYGYINYANVQSEIMLPFSF